MQRELDGAWAGVAEQGVLDGLQERSNPRHRIELIGSILQIVSSVAVAGSDSMFLYARNGRVIGTVLRPQLTAGRRIKDALWCVVNSSSKRKLQSKREQRTQPSLASGISPSRGQC